MHIGRLMSGKSAKGQGLGGEETRTTHEKDMGLRSVARDDEPDASALEGGSIVVVGPLIEMMDESPRAVSARRR